MEDTGPLFSTAGASDLKQIMADLMATAQELHGYVLNNRSREQLSANSEFDVPGTAQSATGEQSALIKYRIVESADLPEQLPASHWGAISETVLAADSHTGHL